jgi:hypothetical protein
MPLTSYRIDGQGCQAIIPFDLGNPDVGGFQGNANDLVSDLRPKVNRAAPMPDQIFTYLNPNAHGPKMVLRVPFGKRGGHSEWSLDRITNMQVIGI